MTTYSPLFLTLVLVESLQEPIDIFLLQVVRRREPQLVRIAATDADLVRLPEPVLEFAALHRGNVHADNAASEGRVG